VKVVPFRPDTATVPAEGMKIGELAHRSRLPIKTLRFYEDRGLLPAAARSPGGYRLFSESSLQRLAFIRRLKALGLTLEEIGECLGAHDAGRLPCAEVQRLLVRQISRVDQRIDELRLLRSELGDLLEHWQQRPQPDAAVICPNLRA
jgi:DNA-binding transcriptional MerR regulator